MSHSGVRSHEFWIFETRRMHNIKYHRCRTRVTNSNTIISQGFLRLTVALAVSRSVGALVSIFREFNGHTEY